MQDVRFALRSLRKSPGFTAAAVLALTVGIGASTSIFSVLDGVLFRPLAFPESERLMRIYQSPPGLERNQWSPANFMDLVHESKTFSSLSAYYPLRWNLRSAEGAEKVLAGAVSANFFQTLQV